MNICNNVPLSLLHTTLASIVYYFLVSALGSGYQSTLGNKKISTLSFQLAQIIFPLGGNFKMSPKNFIEYVLKRAHIFSYSDTIVPYKQQYLIGKPLVAFF